MPDQAKVCLMARPIKLTLSLTGLAIRHFLIASSGKATDSLHTWAYDAIWPPSKNLVIDTLFKFSAINYHFHKIHCVVSREDNPLCPTRTICLFQQGHCVFATEDIVPLSKRTVRPCHRGHCVVSDEDIVSFPKRTLCRSQK